MKWLSQIWWTSLSHNPGWAIAEQTSCYTSQSSDAWLSTWKSNETNLTQSLDTWSLMAIYLSSKEVFNSFIILSIFIIYIQVQKTMGERNRQECISECYIFLKGIYDMWWSPEGCGRVMTSILPRVEPSRRVVGHQGTTGPGHMLTWRLRGAGRRGVFSVAVDGNSGDGNPPHDILIHRKHTEN